jgi:glycosyltransferase involved in cell wall biosynthesis
MKILLSAYACEPNKGSEPEVGWQIAVHLAVAGHDVWVVTRANNRESIERELRHRPPLPSLSFIFFDLPTWLRRWKSGRQGLYTYYLLWQWGAYRLAQKEHARVGFDVVQHVTLASIRFPSFMGGIGIPFIFGPVAGGETAPLRLRWGCGWKGFVREALRDLSNLFIRVDPLVRSTLRRATRIFVTSEQTRSLVPPVFRWKTAVRLAIGYDGPPAAESNAPGHEGFSILYVGEFLYLKGMHLGLRAFSLLLASCPNARLTLIGKGRAERDWKRLAAELQIQDRLTWIPWLTRHELLRRYGQHDVFLFPSLHDSGGFVLLESLSAGLPVVCFNLGGPGLIVDETCGRVISVDTGDRDAIVSRLAEELRRLAADQELRNRLSIGARERAHHFEWRHRIDDVYEPSSLRRFSLRPAVRR